MRVKRTGGAQSPSLSSNLANTDGRLGSYDIEREILPKTCPRPSGFSRRLDPEKNCRDIGPRDMILKDALPNTEVEPETYPVKADGGHLTCEPVQVLSLAHRYFLF